MSAPGDGLSLDPSKAANQEFSKARKGYDPGEVRSFLRRLADELARARAAEDELRAQLDEHAHPEPPTDYLDPGAVTRALGDETVRIIDAARDAAVEIRSKAEEHASRVVRDAHERANILTRNATELRERADQEAEDLLTRAAADSSAAVRAAEEQADSIVSEARAEADELRLKAETVLAERTEIAEAEAEQIRAAANSEADAAAQSAADLRSAAEQFSAAAHAEAALEAKTAASRAEAEALALVDAAKETGRGMIGEAKEARERILRDLAERRQSARQQLEALRAGRERLIEAFGAARQALDEATDELVESLPAARAAATEAARAVVDDLDAEVAELDGMIPPFADAADMFEDVVDVGTDVAAPVTVLPGGATIADRSEDQPDEALDDLDSDELDGDQPLREVGASAELPSEPVDSDGPDSDESDFDGPDSDESDSEVSSSDDGSANHLRLVAAHDDAPDFAPETERDGDDLGNVVGIGVFESEFERTLDDDYDDGDDYDDDDEDFDDDVDDLGTTEQRATGPGLTVVSSGDSAEPEHAVDELFARLRGDQSAATSSADSDAGTVTDPVDPHGDVADPAAALEREVASTMRGGVVIDLSIVNAHQESGNTVVVDAPAVDGRERLLDQRDALLSGLTTSLTRSLKRVVSDQENEVLDLVRRQRKWKSSAKLLEAVDDQEQTCRAACDRDVTAIIEAGVDFVGNVGSLTTEATVEATDEVFEAITTIVIEPLRSRLAKVIDESDDTSPDRSELVDRLRSVYREVRNDRLPELAGDVATLGFNTGILRGATAGDRLCWMVDNGGLPCPDAEDNHLAGEVVAGEDFPTGDRLPPAHPGCRCLLVPPTR